MLEFATLLLGLTQRIDGGDDGVEFGEFARLSGTRLSC